MPAGRLRGRAGGFALTSEIVSAIGQALTMMVGGGVAAGLNGISKAVVGRMAIYGYRAAQGYEASISDAIATVAEEKQSPLTKEETGPVLGDPRTQLGGFINAVAAAALSKRAGRDEEGAFGKEIGAMAGTLFADATDQAIQGSTNQVISEVGNAYAHDKDIRLGNLLDDAFHSSGISVVTGIVPSQAREGGDRAPAGVSSILRRTLRKILFAIPMARCPPRRTTAVPVIPISRRRKRNSIPSSQVPSRKRMPPTTGFPTAARSIRLIPPLSTSGSPARGR